MSIRVFSSTSLLSERLRSIGLAITPSDDSTGLNAGETVICDPETVRELLDAGNDLQLFVLSTSPSYEEGSALLPLGIRGYGNLYMHDDHLKQALDVIASGNVWLYPEFMFALIRSATATAPSTHSELLEKLTERERDTALLVKEGRSNKEIAARLGITERTVKQHISHIFEKLGVGDRLSLAMLLQ